MRTRRGERRENMTAVRSRIVFWLKLLASAVFLIIVLRVAHPERVIPLFRSIRLVPCLVLLLLAALGITISCIKWRILLRTKGHEVALPYLVSLYLLGYFFNNFMPSMVGGDAARGFFLARRIGSPKDAYLSIVMERMTGLVALMSMVVFLVVVERSMIRDVRLEVPLVLLLLVSVSGFVLVFSRTVFHRVLRMIPKRFGAFRSRLDEWHEALREFGTRPGPFSGVLFLSLVFHIFTGINIVYACVTLNVAVDPLPVILITPFIILASLLPITLNGIGLWEGGFVLFLGLAGVHADVALSAALLLRIKNLLVSALGAAVFLAHEVGERGELLRRGRAGAEGK